MKQQPERHQNATGQTTPCNLLVFIESYVTDWAQTIEDPKPHQAIGLESNVTPSKNLTFKDPKV